MSGRAALIRKATLALGLATAGVGAVLWLSTPRVAEPSLDPAGAADAGLRPAVRELIAGADPAAPGRPVEPHARTTRRERSPEAPPILVSDDLAMVDAVSAEDPQSPPLDRAPPDYAAKADRAREDLARRTDREWDEFVRHLAQVPDLRRELVHRRRGLQSAEDDAARLEQSYLDLLGDFHAAGGRLTADAYPVVEPLPGDPRLQQQLRLMRDQILNYQDWLYRKRLAIGLARDQAAAIARRLQ